MYGSKELPEPLDFEITEVAEVAPGRPARWSARLSIAAWVGVSAVAWTALAWGLVQAAGLLGV